MKKELLMLAVIMLCLICAVGHAEGKTFDGRSYTTIADAYVITESDYAKPMKWESTKQATVYFSLTAPRDGTYYITVKPKTSNPAYLYVYDRAQTQILKKSVYQNQMYVYAYKAGKYEKIYFGIYFSSKREGTFSICFDNQHVAGLFSEVTKEPTCTEAGVRTYPCELCNNPAKTEAIPKTGHTGTWKTTKAATCTAAGEKTLECTVCKQKVKEAIPATGHTPGSWVTVQAATTTAEGKQTKSCTVCGTVLETQSIPKIAQTGALSASATSMGNDGSFTVTLSIQNNPGIAYFGIDSNAASKGVTIENAQATGIAQGWSVSTGNKIVLYSTSDATGNGAFLVLTMKSASKEETELSFTVSECYNSNEKNVTVTGTSVKIKKGGLLGDCNGDGVVDGRDLLRLARYIAGAGVEIDRSAADITGDGNVDGRDVLRLAKQLAGN